jgi:hypothetical protein
MCMCAFCINPYKCLLLQPCGSRDSITGAYRVLAPPKKWQPLVWGESSSLKGKCRDEHSAPYSGLCACAEVYTHTHTHEKVNTGKMKTWKDKRRHLKRTLSFRSISWIGLHRGSLSSPHSKCYCELVSAVCQQNGQLFTIWGRFAAPWIS